MDLSALTRGQRLTIGAAVALTVVAGVAKIVDPKSVLTFLVAAAALAALAALVGQSIEQVGERMGPGATGLLQSALGNLPELFVGIFALRAGLVDVVRAALVGSILANTLLILGLAILAGGLRHGAQRFASDSPRMIGTLLLLAVAALLVPTLAFRLHTPAAGHASQLSNAVAVILIAVYVLSIPFWLRGGAETGPFEPATQRSRPSSGDDDTSAPTGSHESDHGASPSGPGSRESESGSRESESGSRESKSGSRASSPGDQLPSDSHESGSNDHPAGGDDPETLWSLPLAIGLLAFASLGAALVSDWFVGALEPATKTLGLSPTFTGLVIVAIASNAVENVGGITFAWKARPDYALSTILNSPLQVALFLTPLLVLVSRMVGPTPLTLVFPTLEVAALALATIVVLVVISDGEYVWLEGVALIGLYGIVTAAFWWG